MKLLKDEITVLPRLKKQNNENIGNIFDQLNPLKTKTAFELRVENLPRNLNKIFNHGVYSNIINICSTFVIIFNKP